MLTPEEMMVLCYLRAHLTARLVELRRSCLPATPLPLLARMIANLEWLGFLVAYPDAQGEPEMVQITENGLARVGGRQKLFRRLAT